MKVIIREVAGRKFKIMFGHFAPGIAEISINEIVLKKRLFGKGFKEREVIFTSGLAVSNLEKTAINLIHRELDREEELKRFMIEFATLGE